MRSRVRTTRSGFTLIELLVVIAIIGVLATLLMPALLKAKEKSNQIKCANNLAQIAKAAYQYATDQRFYPHLSGPGILDGDYTTDTSARCFRAFVWDFSKIDNAESFVCPSGVDDVIAMAPEAKADGRTWIWGQTTGSSTILPSPILANSGDPTLSTTTNLSYGWTKKQITSNTPPSQSQLAADKAKIQVKADASGTASTTHTGNMTGNHKDVMLLVNADTHIERITPTSPGVTSANIATSPAPGVDGANLGVLPDDPGE